MLRTVFEFIIDESDQGTVLGYFLEVVPITLLVGIVYAIGRLIFVRLRGLTAAWGQELARWLFVCYLTGLANLVLVPANLWLNIWSTLFHGYGGADLYLLSGSFNLVPTIFKVLAGEYSMGHWVLKMLVYNFLMYMPLGFLLPLSVERVNDRNIWKIAIAVPVVVEVVQPIMGRSFDIDDVILDFAGILLGYFVAKLLVQKRKKQTDSAA